MSAANVSGLGPERESAAGFESELHISLRPVIAEEAQKAKAAFVAKVSHEFRAPLNIPFRYTF